MATWWRRRPRAAPPARHPPAEQPHISPLARRPARPTAELEDAIGLWQVGRAVSEEIVDAAVSALVAGADSPAVCELAGVQARFAAMDAPPLVPAVLRELDLHPTDPELALEHRTRDLLEHYVTDTSITPRATVGRVDALLEGVLWSWTRGGVAELREAAEVYGLFDDGVYPYDIDELDAKVSAVVAALLADPPD